MTTARIEVAPAAAARQFAKHLEALSYCIDESSWPLKALHTNSNSDSSIDSFRYDFPSFAKSQNIRVTGDYSTFLHSLTDRLAYLMPRVKATSFKPMSGQIFTNKFGLRCANTYVPFKPAVSGDFIMPLILEQYLKRVFMNPEDCKIVVEWLADIIQNPMRRPEWGVYMQGDSGTGKSSIYRVLLAALGDKHGWFKNDYTEPFTKFSEVWADNLIVFFDDAPAQKTTYQKLKQAITRKSMQVQLKGQQKLMEREVYSRVLICYNPIAGNQLIGEKGERRLYVCEPSIHEKDEASTAEWFVGFNDWMEEPDAPTILYHWLKSIDLKDFKPGSITRTAAHARFVGLSASAFSDCIEAFVAPEDGQPRPVFIPRQLTDHLTRHGFRYPDMEAIKAKLLALGYVKSWRVVQGCNDGRRIQVEQPGVAEGSKAPTLTSLQIETIKAAYLSEF